MIDTHDPRLSTNGGPPLATSATPDTATAFVAPDHCANLDTCRAGASCPACEPTVQEVGAAAFSKLHDDPAAFLRQFDARDVHDREAVVVAIAAWGGEAADYVGSFIAETRCRALALGLL